MTCKTNLKSIAAFLEGLEETIISRLIDRAQFKHNTVVYEPGRSEFRNMRRKSLFDLRLEYQEKMDALFGRFRVPEERPFTKPLPGPRRRNAQSDDFLELSDLNSVNLTNDIKNCYLRTLPVICELGDDGHYGSSVEHDVYALQAMSRRVHYGAMYVAEAKYREDPEGYGAMIAAKDTDALMKRLTRKKVEHMILIRVREKVKHMQARVNQKVRKTVRPRAVLNLYEEFIIPLTKKGEVLYLLNRRGRLSAERKKV